MAEMSNLSRARLHAVIITDDRETLTATLSVNNGHQMAALEAEYALEHLTKFDKRADDTRGQESGT